MNKAIFTTAIQLITLLTFSDAQVTEDGKTICHLNKCMVEFANGEMFYFSFGFFVFLCKISNQLERVRLYNLNSFEKKNNGEEYTSMENGMVFIKKCSSAYPI